jgi:hypothetical protein
MILGCLFSRDSSPSDNALPKNPITLKENRFEFYRRSFRKVCSLISPVRTGLLGGKIFLITATVGSSRRGGMETEMEAQ